MNVAIKRKEGCGECDFVASKVGRSERQRLVQLPRFMLWETGSDGAWRLEPIGGVGERTEGETAVKLIGNPYVRSPMAIVVRGGKVQNVIEREKLLRTLRSEDSSPIFASE